MALKPFTRKQLNRIYLVTGSLLLVTALITSEWNTWPILVLGVLAGWLLGWSAA